MDGTLKQVMDAAAQEVHETMKSTSKRIRDAMASCLSPEDLERYDANFQRARGVPGELQRQ